MNALIAFSIKQRVLVLALFVMTFVGGLLAFRQLNIEAYPDPTPPMVDVITQSPGLSAEEIERYITIPIETQTSALRNLNTVRTISLYGLSDAKLQFTFDYTYEEALQQVLNRLSQLPPLLNNAQPQISPVSPIGEIYRYKLVGPPSYSVLELKTLQDWVLQRRFRAVPGVIDVTGWGGKTKTYELQIDLNKLIAYGITLPQMLQTLNNSNINVGGSTINIGPQVAVVRGVGLIRSLDEIRNTMLAQVGGVPVIVERRGDRRRVQSAAARNRRQRQRRRHRAGHRVDAARRKKHADDPAGPAGGRADQCQQYPAVGRPHRAHLRSQGSDRHHDLDRPAQHGRRHRADLFPAMGVSRKFAERRHCRDDDPVRAVLCRRHPGDTRGIGKPVVGRRHRLRPDRRCHGHHGREHIPLAERARQSGSNSRSDPDTAPGGLHGKRLAIFHAASDVNRSIFFAAGIIIAGFIPLFTLSGVEGHIFGPMAKTYAYALAGGLIATFTVTPALSALILPEHVKETETFVVRALHRVYTPMLSFSIRNKAVIVAVAVMLLVVAGIAVRSLGLEFLPKLEEGNLWIRATMPSTISLEEGNSYVNRMRRVVVDFPGG